MRSAVLLLVLSLSTPADFAASFHDEGWPVPHGRKDMPQPSGAAASESPLTGIDALSMTPKPPDLEESARLLKANRERHSQAMEDANRLAQLSRELQQDLERGGSEALPAGSLQKTDEIIKLAKSLKGKMRAF